MSTQKFKKIFEGLDRAYGQYSPGDIKNGKVGGNAVTKRGFISDTLWEDHLAGKAPSLGSIPIRDDSTCSWGCIDIDTYPLEHKKIIEKIRKLELPFIVCRSKSGGAHLFLFTEYPVAAEDLRNKLTQLAVEKEKVSMTLADKESKKKEIEAQPEQTEVPQPQISNKAQEWATNNEWFGSDRVLTSAAMGIHEDLLQEGIDAESDGYYNQINKRMKEYFPQKFAESSTEEKTKAAPVQNVASVSRRSGGRKSVKLTKSQVVIAKKLGVPLEEYAKYVKEGA